MKGGIENTRERLRALYGDRASLTVTRRPTGGTAATLRVPYREVIALHYWEGMPLSRVAAYLGVPLTTAKWRLRYARERLRRELEMLDDRSDEEREP